MKNWYFKIGDIKIKLSASDDKQINLDVSRFQVVDEIESLDANVQIYLHAIEDIPIPDGEKCLSPQEYPVWINNTKVSRVSWDYFRKEPHMRVDYDLLSPDSLECYIRAEYLPWAVTEKYLWAGIGLQYILLHQSHLIFHASYIDVGGKGIIFIAPSGMGKSTQASLWEKHRGVEVVNGDKACVTVSDKPVVHGIPFDGTSGICKDISCPLCGIVLLGQAKENSIKRIPSVLAIQSLFSNIFVDRSVPQEWNKAVDLVIKLVEKVPIFQLNCTPDERAVATLEQALSPILNQRI